jgi:hypothetical protein
MKRRVCHNDFGDKFYKNSSEIAGLAARFSCQNKI